jgi:hypothetical protein
LNTWLLQEQVLVVLLLAQTPVAVAVAPEVFAQVLYL